MKKMSMPQHLLKNMTFHSDYCYEHTYWNGSEEVVKPFQKMVIDGEIVCPRCESEQRNKAYEDKIKAEFKQIINKRVYDTLYKDSIIQDHTLLKATLDNFVSKEKEEIANKRKATEAIQRLKNGDTFNIVLQGNPGAGKSHLAFAILRELNESNLDELDENKKSCLFVNVESMLRLIKDSFSNKQSKYNENYFVELLSKVHYLALDDIGAETGAIGTDKTATDFVQRILYAITTTRQDKATFITTNLSSESLFKIYDQKLISRMFKRPNFIIFKETKDKRRMDLPF